MKTPQEIVDIMMKSDAFSQWLGIEVEKTELGYCQLSCTVDPAMLNGFSIAHGGITYSIADSCLAFASNSHGYQCVSIETSISHVKKVVQGDRLTASSREISRNKKTALYEVNIVNQKQELVANFKGSVFITDRIW